jgi:hypothetical protein
MALKLARYLLKGTHANILVGVHLQGVGNTFMMVSGRQGEMRSIENPIQAEDTFTLENLDDALLFPDHVAELIRQLMWSFNWAEREGIIQKTREILTRHQIP